MVFASQSHSAFTQKLRGEKKSEVGGGRGRPFIHAGGPTAGADGKPTDLTAARPTARPDGHAPDRPRSDGRRGDRVDTRESPPRRPR